MPSPSLQQIKASAGSGKTFELTGIFLDLLVNARSQQSSPSEAACQTGASLDAPVSYDWPEIMAATFTNRAAAEMKERILLRLKEMALGLAPLPVHWTRQAAHVWVTRILRHLSTLNVRTIDSLLNQLVRLAALDLHIPPDFTPAFSNEESFAPLMDDLLERVRVDGDSDAGDPRLTGLLEQVCTTQVLHLSRKGFGAGTRVRQEIDPYLRYGLTHDWPELTPPETLFTRRATLLSTLRERAQAMADFRGTLNFVKHFDNLITSCQVPTGSISTTSAYWDKDEFTPCVLKASHHAITKDAELAFGAFVRAGRAFRTEGALLHKALAASAFTAIAEELLIALPELQFAQKSLPAERIPFYAQKILGGIFGAPDAFCRLGSRLSHILIDEFQDTSQEQWGALQPLIVEALSKGGSLTWVGDVKQAIYGWRGGDAALFDDIALDPEMNAIAGDAVLRSLPYNWRSCPEIIHFNNTIWAELCEAEHSAALLSTMLPKDMPPLVLAQAAVRLSRIFDGAAQEVPHADHASSGYVRMENLHAEKEEELQALVKEKLELLLRDLLTRKRAADITILVRSNAAAARYAQWLVEWNIPVVTENSLLLAEHPLIAQLIAFLRFLTQSDDDTAFWDFVSGTRLFLPLTHLDYEALDSFCAGERSQTLASHFFRNYPELWQHWIQPFYRMAGLMTAYDTVREAIRHFQVAERFPEDAPFVQRLLECAFLAEKEGASTLSAFLERWDNNAGNEKVPMPAHLDAVQVLTIHKSKGLQFPVVILPTHHGQIRAHSSLHLYQSAKLTFLGALCKEMGDVYYEQLAKDARESLHLLYVGWTRAVEELHGFLTSTAKNAGSGLAAAVSHMLPETCFDENGLLEWGTPCAIPAIMLPPSLDISSAADNPAPLLPVTDTELPAPMLPMSWLPRLKIFRSNFEALGFGANKRGTLAHCCLEALKLNMKMSGDALRNAVERAVDYAFAHFPLPVPDERTMRAEMIEMLLWYAALPQAAFWQEKGVPEQDMLSANNEHLRADRIIFDQGEYTVLDYKTGAREKKHEKQLRDYLHALHGATGIAAHGFLVYLDQRVLHPVVA